MQCGMCEVGTKVLNIIRTSFILHRHNGHGIRVSAIIFKRIIYISFCSGLNTKQVSYTEGTGLVGPFRDRLFVVVLTIFMKML
jgi:hypothetical protein